MERGASVGVVGLGTMGRNLALNLATHEFPVAAYDRDPQRVAVSWAETGSNGQLDIRSFHGIEEFVKNLQQPRQVLLMVPAEAVDEVLGELGPHLSPGDLVADLGNSNPAETERRERELRATGLHFLGVGISGGHAGARHGPCIMPGGLREAYARVQPMFEEIAAKVDGQACVSYLGFGGAGHVVKTVHNGLEYALMQSIAECYDVMKRGLGLGNEAISDTFASWDRGGLGSFLMGITGRILARPDPKGPGRLIDHIRSEVTQKGTGRWAVAMAQGLGAPAPIMAAAVAARDLSTLPDDRSSVASLLKAPDRRFEGPAAPVLRALRDALEASWLLAYSEAFLVLRRANEVKGQGIPLAEVARIWRGGSIVRSGLLDVILSAYHEYSDGLDLPAMPPIAEGLTRLQDGLRLVVRSAADAGLPAPGMMASLSLLDAWRSPWLPANLTQAQRDWFGAHGYLRRDGEGVFHTDWEG